MPNSITLKPVKEALESIKATSKRTEKEDLIDQYLKGSFGPDFSETLTLAYHPYLQFKTQSCPYLPKNKKECTIGELFLYMRELAAKNGVKKDEIELLGRMASVDKETNEVVNMILKKDLRCGIGEKTVEIYTNIPTHNVMLCEKDLDKFLKHVGNIDQVVSSIKKDGVRVWAIYDNGKINYISRNGKEFPNFHVFDNDITYLAKYLEDEKFKMILDGEIYDKTGQFTNLMSNFRALTNVDTSLFVFDIFDTPTWGHLRFVERYHLLDDVITLAKMEEGVSERTNLLVHEFARYSDPKEIEEHAAQVIDEEEEGLVLKSRDGLYELKRSREWCKIKSDTFKSTEQTDDLAVVDIKPGTGKYKGMIGALMCEYKGNIVKVGTGLSDDQRKDFLKDCPKIIEVKHQGESKNKKGGLSLRFPRFARIRDDL